MEEKPKDPGLLGGIVVAAIAASLCCIGPLLLAGAGMTAIVIANKFAVVRPYLLVLTGLLLAVGFYYAYRPVRESCGAGDVCGTATSRRRVRVGLWLATAFALILTTFPYWSPIVARGLTQQPQMASRAQVSGVPVEKATLHLSGMVCDLCALGIENTLRKQPGVHFARVSFSRAAAEVEYDPLKTSLPELRNVIEKAGYQVLGIVSRAG